MDNLGMPGLQGVPRLNEGEKLTKRDFTSAQAVRWCPGCGDYSVLAAFQLFLPALGIRRENVAVVSGIGCSSRFPYYLDTYGLHSIHGRAPAVATGLAVARPDLSVWVVTGDGDALSIGGNHLIHAMRRNVNINILLFNNRIYGLTKGQYSPTTTQGQRTKSSPMGAVDFPFNPVSLALGAEASFVARTIDSDRAHLTETLRAAAEHRGTSVVEIYQNCPIFNDGAFELVKDRDQAATRVMRLQDGEPVTVGSADSLRVVVAAEQGGLQVLPAEQAQAAGLSPVVHQSGADDPTQAFALSRLDAVDFAQVPVGIFRKVNRPVYDDEVRSQVQDATEAAGGPAEDANLADLLTGNDSWEIS